MNTLLSSIIPVNKHVLMICIVAHQDPNTTLIPKDTKSYVSVLQWCSFANAEVLPALGLWFRPIIGRDPYNKKSVEQAEVRIKRVLSFLENVLLHQTYLVGERLTIADLIMTAHLDRGFQYVYHLCDRTEFLVVRCRVQEGVS